jgi:hypothetical protein
MLKNLKRVAGVALVAAASMYGTTASADTFGLDGLLEITTADLGGGLPDILGIDVLNGLVKVGVGGPSLLSVDVIAGVPEPETFAMMGLGLGLVALAVRRRRSGVAA